MGTAHAASSATIPGAASARWRARTAGAGTDTTGQTIAAGRVDCVQAHPYSCSSPFGTVHSHPPHACSHPDCEETTAMHTAPRQVHVRVPATTANLGSGFDILGLALQLYN